MNIYCKTDCYNCKMGGYTAIYFYLLYNYLNQERLQLKLMNGFYVCEYLYSFLCLCLPSSPGDRSVKGCVWVYVSAELGEPGPAPGTLVLQQTHTLS